MSAKIQTDVRFNFRIYSKFIKRPMDLVISFFAIILLSPVFIVVAILVKFKLGSPVIFKQKRPGLHEEIFTMYKFRTMTDEKDHNGELLPDSVRLTEFGKLLRATSLDELPEFINILRGDMSLVGPRPLLIQYLELYSEEQKRRHHVKPGLTGYAQINGRNTIKWEDKFMLDVEYVDNISFLRDCKIILKTIDKVFTRADINSDLSVTMEPFIGVNEDR